jgi:7-cyano-7-deazaguanine synthase
MAKEDNAKSAVLILSGGMDSTTLLWQLLSEDYNVHALTINYGQRHVIEIDAARNVVQKAEQVARPLGLGVSWKLLELDAIQSILGGSSQTDPRIEVPKGHYADKSMKLTVVPNRNMIMLSLAAAYSISLNCYSIAYGAHAGDHAIYPDCRPEFIREIRAVLNTCHYDKIELYTPFMNKSKDDILRIGISLKVPFGLTRTCYTGHKLACGKCGSCTERLEAFELNGMEDPIGYST